jgi:hypothetical protein
VPAVWPAKRGGRPARLARCRARVGGRLRPVRTRRGPRRPGDATPERGFGRRLGSLVWAHCRGQPSRAAPASPPRRFPRWRRARGPSFRRIPGWRGSRPLRRSLPASAPTSTRTGGIESAATTTGWPADCGLWALRLPWAPRSGGGSRDGGLNDIERLRVQASPSLAAATDRREVDEFLAAGRGAPARGGGREGAERPTPRARGALRRRDDRGRAGEGVGLARLARRRAGRPSALRVLAPVGVPDHYYYFYLRDRDWGPAFVKTVAYAPFPIWIYLNGHRWAKRQAERQGLRFEALDNGFRAVDAAAALQAICDPLGAREVERFQRRWQARLPSPFTSADRRRGTATSSPSVNSSSPTQGCSTVRRRAAPGSSRRCATSSRSDGPTRWRLSSAAR